MGILRSSRRWMSSRVLPTRHCKLQGQCPRQADRPTGERRSLNHGCSSHNSLAACPPRTAPPHRSRVGASATGCSLAKLPAAAIQRASLQQSSSRVTCHLSYWIASSEVGPSEVVTDPEKRYNGDGNPFPCQPPPTSAQLGSAPPRPGKANKSSPRCLCRYLDVPMRPEH